MCVCERMGVCVCIGARGSIAERNDRGGERCDHASNPSPNLQDHSLGGSKLIFDTILSDFVPSNYQGIKPPVPQSAPGSRILRHPSHPVNQAPSWGNGSAKTLESEAD